MKPYSANWNDGAKKREGLPCGSVALILIVVFVTSILAFTRVRADSQPQFTSSQSELLMGKAIGESSVDPYSVACTMRMRLEGGWSPKLVHTAFHAKWTPPSKEQAEKLLLILNGDGDCNNDLWYQWSLEDVKAIRPNESCFLFESAGNRFYSKCALWR